MELGKVFLIGIVGVCAVLWGIGQIQPQDTQPIEGKSMLVDGKVKYCIAADTFDSRVRQTEITMRARFDRVEAHRRAVMAELAALSLAGNAPCVMGRKYDGYGNETGVKL